ncbi:MAG: Stp1/IreP family PP2C-type Ser/Thr phosphatase [Clostridia bacterium]|nr:Stp1/IreP family PP2C-type Ser/Thr phosphatase [Clostridia bacterium]
MRVCQRTHQGLVRASNQDSLLVEQGIYGVADGMGGHNGGETASRVTVQVIKNALHGKKAEHSALATSIEAANRRVYDMARHDSALRGMGTTLTFLWEADDAIHLGHVGDSRAYLWRGGSLVQITEDHSLVAELLRKNMISPEAARTHPYRNVITRAVGVDPVVEADVFEHDKQAGDLWLVCSDGLTNMVPDNDIADILEQAESDENAADELLALALERGGTDNITFVLCRVAEVNEA